MELLDPAANVKPSAFLSQAVEAMGYVHPTRIQAACLRPALEGRDLLANAQTGEAEPRRYCGRCSLSYYFRGQGG